MQVRASRGWHARPAPSRREESFGADRAPSAPRRPPPWLSELSPPLRPPLLESSSGSGAGPGHLPRVGPRAGAPRPAGGPRGG
eukprot:10263758-Lingulodinium_polyedra.AAC.1